MARISKNIKVMIVEDNANICEMYAITFMRRGFTVYTASDGRSAIQKYHNKKPDIILLDIMMPQVDGYQVLNEVRKDVNTYTPVIMLTNLDADDFSRESRLENIDAYLIKSHHSPREVVDKTIEVLKINNIAVD
ncbi:response regulator [Patescibacteria group bacterium]|nr:response regulator [Patescibacteria group bacterium]MBU1015916.1 response regulator [Patescibacteria group bacterium]MBU1685085.1 response regulator [Patescibacteria group bacterium]MBU1938152.1 response regulator [Patescibacteria group bacterium]